MIIDDVEGTDAVAVRQLVVHEVHRPELIGLGRLLQRLWCLPDKPFAWFDAQAQLMPILCFKVILRLIIDVSQCLPYSDLPRQVAARLPRRANLAIGLRYFPA